MQWREPDIDDFIGVPGVAVGDDGLHGQDHPPAVPPRGRARTPGRRGEQASYGNVKHEPSHSDLG